MDCFRLLTGCGLAAALFGAAGPLRAPAAQSAQPPKTVIAHRGASGYLPEHTLAAYATAHAQGADYIEPDVVLTSDGVLICLHDMYLETTTDVAERFPDRKRADGHWHALDFTLAEVKSLRFFGRVRASERDRLPEFKIPTLEELIRLVQHLNRTTGRDCGLLVETKNPTAHLRQGKPMEQALLDLLARYGYRGPEAKAIIQSFDAAGQKRLREEHKTDLRLVLLSGAPFTDAALQDAATYCWGVAPNRLGVGSRAFVESARRHGLKVFVWTFNAEEAEMRRFLWDYGIDGVITNHPDVGRRAAAPQPAD